MMELQTENVKNSLRIFGLPDDEHELTEHTKDKFVSEVHKVAFPNSEFKDDDIKEIKRIGKYNGSKPRMVVVKFVNDKLKASIFSSRDQLRAKGIRVSNSKAEIERVKYKRHHRLL